MISSLVNYQRFCFRFCYAVHFFFSSFRFHFYIYRLQMSDERWICVHNKCCDRNRFACIFILLLNWNTPFFPLIFHRIWRVNYSCCLLCWVLVAIFLFVIVVVRVVAAIAVVVATTITNSDDAATTAVAATTTTLAVSYFFVLFGFPLRLILVALHYKCASCIHACV